MAEADPCVWICGLDLSGPAKPEDTALTWFTLGPDSLLYAGHKTDLSDAAVCEELSGLCHKGHVVVAADAPLSYHEGGGYRCCDSALRSAVTAAGYGFVGVMAPTMMRMVYLTLRGVVLARQLEGGRQGNRLRTLEVHPGAVMALRKAPKRGMKFYKKGSEAALKRLKDWLGQQGLQGLPANFGRTPHEIDSGAAALGAWHWHMGRSAWLWPAEGSHMPYDFAC